MKAIEQLEGLGQMTEESKVSVDEEYEFEQPTEAELEKCLAHVRYTQHIDKVYRNLKDKTNVAMHRLEP